VRLGPPVAGRGAFWRAAAPCRQPTPRDWGIEVLFPQRLVAPERSRQRPRGRVQSQLRRWATCSSWCGCVGFAKESCCITPNIIPQRRCPALHVRGVTQRLSAGRQPAALPAPVVGCLGSARRAAILGPCANGCPRQSTTGPGIRHRPHIHSELDRGVNCSSCRRALSCGHGHRVGGT
jgi:hypothetical protein